MQIRKLGFLYRTTYAFARVKPDRVRLCGFCWRCIIMLLLLPTTRFLIVCMRFAAFFSLAVLGFIVCPLFGTIGTFSALLNSLTTANIPVNSCHLHEYPLPTLRGRRVLPIFPIAIIALGFLVSEGLTSPHPATRELTSCVLHGIALAALVPSMIYLLASSLSKLLLGMNSVLARLRAWSVARRCTKCIRVIRQRLCPTIKCVD